MLSEAETYETLKRLKNHPAILESLKGILDITEGAKEIEKADDAEFALIPEVRGLGKKFIEDWEKHQAEEKMKEHYGIDVPSSTTRLIKDNETKWFLGSILGLRKKRCLRIANTFVYTP